MDKLIIGCVLVIATFIGNYEPSTQNTPSVVEQEITPIAPAMGAVQIEKIVTADDLAAFTKCQGQERQRAIHEAGHFFLYMQQGIGISEATIVPNEYYGGFVRPSKSNDIANAGGYAAEIMFITHDKSVEDFMRNSGLASRYERNWDLGKLFQTDKQAFYDMVVEACKRLEKHEAEILTIASCLYKRKTLNQNDCYALHMQILNKEAQPQ